MAKKAVIIGAGPGGLATALLLAKSGLDVTILERLPRVGGRTSTIEVQGFRFDVGPTFFLYPRILKEILASVGRSLSTEVPMKRLDPQYRLVYGSGGELLATPNVERMEKAISALCPRDAASLRPFLNANRAKLERFRPCMESPFLSPRDLLSPHLIRLLPLLRPWRSLDEELQKFFSDPRIRLALSFQSKYLGMSPFQCPSLFSILSFLEYEYGVYHPIGGCGAVTQTMARIAREMGVDVRTSEPVEEIVFQGKRAIGVRTSEGVYESGAIVVNADFAGAMPSLVPDRIRRRWTDRKIAKKKYSCSTFMMYLGVEGSYPDVPHHTIYLAKNYVENLMDIEKRHILSEDPSFYLQNACVSDSTLAPEEMSTLYVLVPVTHQHPNVDWDQEREAYREKVFQQLGKIGLERIQDKIRFEKIVTPRDWEEGHKIYRGATFNLSHNLTQMLHMRPRNRFEDLESVYLVGGGTHPGSGLPVIFESARITSRLLCEDLGLEPVQTDFSEERASEFEEVA